MLKDNFSDCLNYPCHTIFKVDSLPVFQNLPYPTREQAVSIPRGKVHLKQSSVSGFIFNECFDPSLVEYNEDYQNEQSHSEFFREHLNNVLAILENYGLKDRKIIEIGCGKGAFVELLNAKRYGCLGFDPAYEGGNPNIIKENFSDKFSNIGADIIILRHTLEHIQKPFSFLHTIAAANGYRGMIFIEVPTFTWIYEKKAFWDIFYEHCNYFTPASLSLMFEEAECHDFFEGQYMYLWADLAKLRQTIPPVNHIKLFQSTAFDEKADYYREIVKSGNSTAIWGAGAKGCTFLNIVDPGREYIKYAVDINPFKQNKYIGGTGHPIYAPGKLKEDGIDRVILMNENYLDEVKAMVAPLKINILSL